jgi:uncharacterized protein YbjT (DUF2867 family)
MQHVMKRVLIFGGSGLVGTQFVMQALASAEVSQVVAPTRRLLTPNAKLVNPQVQLDALPLDAEWWHCDAVVIALGTTIKTAGSKAAFRAVDVDAVLAIGRTAKAAGVTTCVLNSSAGASSTASSFYLRCKAEAEDGLAQLGFQSYTVVRPSLLAGDRHEFRLGERIGLGLFAVLKPLIPARYRAVHASAVASSMLASALQAKSGRSVLESDMLV